MSHELIYTSAERGLRPGEHGFCTVAVTQGIPAALSAKLESLCGYRHLFPPSDRRAALNPVMHAHYRLQLDGKIWHVLTRIADAGLDHTQRTNKFCHHVALDRSELPPGGPAWALGQPGLMETAWDGRAPQVIPAGRRPSADDDAPPRRCKRWEDATGDAGWAGTLAGWTTPAKPAYLIFRPGQDPLPLIAEALALLPQAQRWAVTFSTYFLGLPPDVPCQWRSVPAGSPEAEAVLEAGGNVITLEPGQGRAPDGPLAESARTGRVHHPSEPAARTRSTPTAAPASVSAVPTSVRRAADEAASAYAVAHAEPMPASVPHRSGSRIGGFIMLLLGLILGLALMFLCILPLELVTGRSVPRVAGLVGKDEEELRGQVEKLQRDLETEKKQSDVLKKERDQTQARMTQMLEEMRPGPGTGKKPDPEVRTPDPIEKKPELWQTVRDFWEWLHKLPTGSTPSVKPMVPPDRPAPQPIPIKPPVVTPGVPLPSVKIELSLMLPKLDAAPAGKRTPLKPLPHEPKAAELLGLPTNINGTAVGVQQPKGDIIVKVGDEELATFHRGKAGEDWDFAWGPAKGRESDKARAALLRCVLKITPTEGAAVIYPLQQPETLKTILKPVQGAKEPTFVANLPLNFDPPPDSKEGAFVFGKSGTAVVNSQILSLKRHKDLLVGGSGTGDTKVELSLDGALLRLRSTGDKPASEVKSLQLTLVRVFEGQEVPVIEIK